MFFTVIWGKVFKNGPRKICRRQPLKNLKGPNILKGVFHFFYLVHSWMLCPIYIVQHMYEQTFAMKKDFMFLFFREQRKDIVKRKKNI